MYTTLDVNRIIQTIEALEWRIGERFPRSGLAGVCGELKTAAHKSRTRIDELCQPNYLLRGISFAATACGVVMLIYIATIIEVKRDSENLYGVLQGFDSAFNIVVLMGAGALFLSSLENRWKRQRAMQHLHELRSIIHVIDMHQLTKDPSRISNAGVTTSHSPDRPLTAFELSRYLDYCSEMLSLSAKVAALYAQGTQDPLVVETSSDLGQITANMAGKIWQKITLIQTQIDEEAAAATVPLPTAPAALTSS